MSIQNHDCKIYIIVTRSYLSRSLSSDFRVRDKGKTSHAIKLLTKPVYWMISFSLIYNLYRLTINNKQINKQIKWQLFIAALRLNYSFSAWQICLKNTDRKFYKKYTENKPIKFIIQNWEFWFNCSIWIPLISWKR